MKQLLILGAGTAGTMAANHLYNQLDKKIWQITIVDEDPIHYYQPGFLFIPFGIYGETDVIKPKKQFIPDGVRLLNSTIERVDAENNQLFLENQPEPLLYDYLIIATGTTPRPDQTPGLSESEWRSSIHDFYTYDGAVALAKKLRDWPGGKLVVAIMETPFKCPVAPLEFIFLADAYFTNKGIRDNVTLTLATPMSGAFTKPKATQLLSSMLDEKKIEIIPDFYPERVAPKQKEIIAYDEQTIPYDLLVTVPVNMGADYVARSGLGDELNHVRVDKHTFQSNDYPNIFALGDAANIPTSKAGSVAHFAVEIFVENFQQHIQGLPMTHQFDGHANCFIESGHGKAILIDFNYDTEPLPGTFPYPTIGPFSLLKETKINHLGKLAFRWTYWNMLLKGKHLPVSTAMSMSGKELGQ